MQAVTVHQVEVRGCLLPKNYAIINMKSTLFIARIVSVCILPTSALIQMPIYSVPVPFFVEVHGFTANQHHSYARLLHMHTYHLIMNFSALYITWFCNLLQNPSITPPSQDLIVALPHHAIQLEESCMHGLKLP